MPLLRIVVGVLFWALDTGPPVMPRVQVSVLAVTAVFTILIFLEFLPLWALFQRM